MGPGHTKPAAATGTTTGAAKDVSESRPAWLAQLSDADVIAVTGPDSERFLQGQLSCNMSRLSPTQSLRAALCNLKGRVVADLRVLLHDGRILLICSAGMADIVLTTLNKYKVFFKTELQPVSEQFVILGVAGNACEQAFSAVGIEPPAIRDVSIHSRDTTIIRVQESPARFYCVLGGTNGELASDLSSRCDSGSELDWRLADIRDGIAHIRPGQQDMYTPQVLNYDINGVIDFKKGCYTGQEVVARMYYRADAKKRLRHVTLESRQQLPEGIEIVDAVESKDGPTQALAIMPVTTD